MADDVRLGRTTEIDDLCGAIVRLGKSVNVDTSANARMIDLLKTYDGTRTSGAMLLRKLEG